MVSSQTIPHLEDIPGSKQLIVHGKPYLILGGELNNSSFSSPAFMNKVWPKVAATHVNTVLGAVTWEDVEPSEGEFNFAELDQVISSARSHGLKLILLWFGAFKNGQSVYAPSWVKRNPRRFPRAKMRIGENQSLQMSSTLSVFSKTTVEADAAAFKVLMAHLKELDEAESTIIMVQVENEIGILGDSRDRSGPADEVFRSPVPEELISFINDKWDSLHPHLKDNLKHFTEQRARQDRNASWEATFGQDVRTDEMFMAYHIAKYVEKVASVGRSQYPIPLYTNAAMNDVNADDIRDFPFVAGGTVPGVYPSGGPVPTVLDIWQNFAPTIDFIGPDIYLGNYETACGHFQHRQQPLFIPEQRRDAYGARRAWTAFGSFQAIGVAPFGIDSQDPTDTAFATTYMLLSKVSRQILAAQKQPSSIYGFHFDEVAADGKDAGTTISITMADWNLSIQRTFVFGRRGPGYGIIIHQGAGKFLLVGEGYQVAFKQPGKTFTGILAVRELDVADSASGNLEVFRKLNGDETQSGNAVILPSAKPDTGGFPIPCFLPANTRIVECEVYSVDEDDSLA